MRAMTRVVAVATASLSVAALAVTTAGAMHPAGATRAKVVTTIVSPMEGFTYAAGRSNVVFAATNVVGNVLGNCSINWGDGSLVSVAKVTNGACAANHTYMLATLYTTIELTTGTGTYYRHIWVK